MLTRLRLVRSSLSHSSFRGFSQVDASKDYYKVLGVTRSEEQGQIKKAFYKLAKQYHPDVYKGGESKIKEINEAWEVLGDKDKKTQYD